MVKRICISGVVRDLYDVENGSYPIVLFVAVEAELASAGDAPIVECDVTHRRRRVAFYSSSGCVAGVEGDGVGRVANTDVVVDYVVRQAAARAVALDADAVIGAVEGEIEDADFAYAAIGFTANGHAVSPIKVVMTDGHVGYADRTSTLDGYVVVAGADVAVSDGDVLRSLAGIDAVSVTRQALRRVDL